MTHRKRLSSLAIIAVLSLVLTSLVSSPAHAGKNKTRGKVDYGVTSWAAGTAGYSIDGKASGRTSAPPPMCRWAPGVTRRAPTW